MTAYFMYSQMANGVRVDWFEIDGTIYGYNSRRGITDRYGFEIEIDAAIAVKILQMRAKLA